MKTGANAEDIVVAYCANKLQRPVKWIAERSEDFLTSAHGRDIVSKGELALDANGKILALRIHNQANVGAYPGMTGVAIQVMIGPWVQTSVYDIQNIDFHYTAVLTNTAPTGAYRGAGRPEAIFNIERLMDEAARQSGIDRVTLRRRNFIPAAAMPYSTPVGPTYDTGDFVRLFDRVLVLESTISPLGKKKGDWQSPLENLHLTTDWAMPGGATLPSLAETILSIQQ